jgi:hypothetical protein
MAVYFLQAGTTDAVKIGKADDPAARMAEFQCCHYEKLHLLRTIEGGYIEEARLHRHYRQRLIRAEWFHYCPTMLTIEAEFAESPSGSIIDEAIRLCGSPTALARAAGVKLPSIYSWKRLPAERVGRISAHTGIPPHELRPDVFPAPRATAA